MATDRTTASAGGAPEAVSHFWVCGYPVLKTSLFMVRKPGTVPGEAAGIYIYDADGGLANEVKFDFAANQAGVLELDGLLESCKLEGGFKHGHLEVRARPEVRPYLRMHTAEGAFLQGEPAQVSTNKGAFVPVLFSQTHSSFLVLVNHGKSDMTVRCRLFCGRRNPEITQLVPALGARVISVPSRFPEFALREGAAPVQAYFRITANSDGECGVQLIESVIVRENQDGFFGSIS